jgi:hypothetical protein
VSQSKEFWLAEEVRYLFDKLATSNLSTDAITHYGDLLARIPEGDLGNFCSAFLCVPSAARSALIRGLGKLNTDVATVMLEQLVIEGEEEAIYNLYSHIRFHRKGGPGLNVNDDLVCALVRAYSSLQGNWAIELGQVLIARNPEWGESFSRVALTASDSDRIMIEITLAGHEQIGAAVDRALSNLPLLNPQQISAIAENDYWKVAPCDRIVAVLKTRNAQIAGKVLEQAQGRTGELDLLRTNPLDWWLDWMEECKKAGDGGSSWCCFMLSQFLARGSEETRREVIGRFNRGASPDFWRIGSLLFYDEASGISTDELSENAIDALVRHGHVHLWVARLLGHAATEEFVNSVLLPRFARFPDQGWIRQALELAGLRHNRRYIVSG